MAVQSLRKEFHSELASTILADIQQLKSQYYYFLGKTNSWNSNDVPPTDVETDSHTENYQIRSNAVYFQKINHNDVSLVTKRHNWVVDTVYPSWDHTIDMSNEAFYVLTDEFNVYKCLDNANGSPSTIKPTGQSYTHFKTTDGYTWKYMYNIPTFKRTKFLSSLYIPVQKALTDSFYDNGSIESVSITNGGSGYTDTLLTYIQVASNTVTGSGASLSLVTNLLTGAITSVTVGSGGSGYTAGVKLKITDGIGSGAILTPVITAGVITSVTVVDGGYGYSSSDTIVASVGGAIIVPSISRNTGEIIDVKILDSGSGYSSAPALTVSVIMGQIAGTGKYGTNSTAILNAIIDGGEIVRVTISDPGQNYPADTSTTITAIGDGTGVSLSPVIYNGEIVDVIIENSGTGYTYLQLNVVGDGSGAILKASTTGSDYVSNQSIVEQTTVIGGIYSVKITDGGTNYSADTTAEITGDGTGATCSLVVEDGVIVRINMTNIGQNYSYASITLNDPNRITAPIGSIDASAYPIISPRRGHGFNAVDELYGDTLSIVSLLKADNGLDTFSIEQEFRQYGILKDPSYISSTRFFRGLYDLVVYTVKSNTVDGLIEDEILTGNGVRYRVLSFNALDDTIVLQKLSDSALTLGGLSAESEPSRTYGILEVLSRPNIDKYSGRLLYVSDENPFILGEEQGIQIKTFIRL